ncbi:MAG: UDP-N-acetylmuramoyl-L-alanine--D-glutamate ligase [Candidatus Hydrogenedentes bacterium]|nr:UDP-N-acetylmuramoyl-L-alanine--D-glutamate ligase [Candidatus Hydrogenedentota bacterium]
MLDNLNNKKITIAGTGRSARAALDLVQARGARPFVSDAEPIPEAFRQELDRCGIPWEDRGHSPAKFAQAGLVVLSPGVPLRQPAIEAALAAGVPVIGELELASWYCAKPILAITGTNGKTTATQLLHHLVQACGMRSMLVGNNDTPFCSVVDALAQVDYVVAEVSSYQLETILHFRPHVAAVLNITPDHLARHGTLEGYAEAKARIFMNQTAADFAVLNGDDARVAALPLPAGAARRTFSQRSGAQVDITLRGTELFDSYDRRLGDLSGVQLPGAHNRENILAVVAMMECLGFAPESYWPALCSFPGVEHRLERAGDCNGVRIINDSKSTNVDSLRVALESFPEPIVLIAGGVGKGAPYEPLLPLVKDSVRALVAIGSDGPRLQRAFGGVTAVHAADSMAAAVDLAISLARPGDVVLLSPACASFDWYENFEARGRDFKACAQMAINRLTAAPVSQPG